MSSDRPKTGETLRISDLVILAAALALGVGLGAYHYQTAEQFSPTYLRMTTASLVVTLLAIGLIPIQLRQPMPTLRHVGRQPGFQASVAVCVTMLLMFIWYCACLVILRNYPMVTAPDFLNTIGNIDQKGEAIAVAWITLATSGRWRAEPSWIDRLGRLLGASFVIAALYDAAIAYTYYR